ncbi:MAG: phosphoribosylformylglycinamidine synthase I [Candidatus Levybacteria bacterium RIFCSPLOWO2_01_FULL_39_10]|nr:MAG: phosphoribosylformylglycinamidine synthase I [Candidatus Levybacteria bacterium RIFCSPLOWO2_01_FULL_39_10]
MKKPKALILKADGINRDEEMAYAFNIAGAEAELVHINDLRSKKKKLSNFQILGIPGGFAYGDDIVSGKILATELVSYLSDELQKFVSRTDTAVIGVCNGFQVLVRTGLVPFGKVGKMDTTLVANDSGHFECRWVKIKIEKNSKSKFLKGLENQIIWYPVAHGEGKFFARPNVLSKIEKDNLVAFRYVDESGVPIQNYPDNPNGSINAIVGISDITGRVLGLMPHPECFVRAEQHPNWRRGNVNSPQGLPLFKNIVNFVSQ